MQVEIRDIFEALTGQIAEQALEIATLKAQIRSLEKDQKGGTHADEVESQG